MKRSEIEREDRRQVAIFEEWVTNGRYTHPRLTSFQDACDRGEIHGLSRKDFEKVPLDGEAAEVAP